MAGREAGIKEEQYAKTTKAIAEFVGQVYGHEMKVLVLKGQENVLKEPEYPKIENDKEKEIWRKNQRERASEYETAEMDIDVVAVLKIIKRGATGSPGIRHWLGRYSMPKVKVSRRLCKGVCWAISINHQ